MAYGEAIKCIKINICYRQEVCSDGICKGTEEKPCAIDVAIEALDKQIPKKPYIGKYGGKCWCPSCNDEDEMDIYGTSYCPNCGQAIDWSDEE